MPRRIRVAIGRRTCTRGVECDGRGAARRRGLRAEPARAGSRPRIRRGSAGVSRRHVRPVRPCAAPCARARGRPLDRGIRGGLRDLLAQRVDPGRRDRDREYRLAATVAAVGRPRQPRRSSTTRNRPSWPPLRNTAQRPARPHAAVAGAHARARPRPCSSAPWTCPEAGRRSRPSCRMIFSCAVGATTRLADVARPVAGPPTQRASPWSPRTRAWTMKFSRSDSWATRRSISRQRTLPGPCELGARVSRKTGGARAGRRFATDHAVALLRESGFFALGTPRLRQREGRPRGRGAIGDRRELRSAEAARRQPRQSGCRPEELLAEDTRRPVERLLGPRFARPPADSESGLSGPTRASRLGRQADRFTAANRGLMEPDARRDSAAASMALKRGWSRMGSRSGSIFAQFTASTQHVLEHRLEQVERGLEFGELQDERAGEVVAHVQVVRIEQHRALDPFLRALDLAQRGQRADAVSSSPIRCRVPARRSSRRGRARAAPRAAAPSASPIAL